MPFLRILVGTVSRNYECSCLSYVHRCAVPILPWIARLHTVLCVVTTLRAPWRAPRSYDRSAAANASCARLHAHARLNAKCFFNKMTNGVINKYKVYIYIWFGRPIISRPWGFGSSLLVVGPWALLGSAGFCNADFGYYFMRYKRL